MNALADVIMYKMLKREWRKQRGRCFALIFWGNLPMTTGSSWRNTRLLSWQPGRWTRRPSPGGGDIIFPQAAFGNYVPSARGPMSAQSSCGFRPPCAAWLPGSAAPGAHQTLTDSYDIDNLRSPSTMPGLSGCGQHPPPFWPGNH